MKLIFKPFILLSLFLLSGSIFGQLDSNKKSKKKNKALILNSSKKSSKPKSISVDPASGFKSAYKKEKEKLKKEKKEREINNKGIITKELYRKNQFQKIIEKNTLQIPMIDKDIGVFRTKSLNINLFAFDFGTIDGDVVTIFKNGKPFKKDIALLKSGEIDVIVIPLDKGFNKIEILAVNEGRLRPNTGAFTLFDDFKKEVYSDLWNLAKGAKVIAHIIREKP